MICPDCQYEFDLPEVVLPDWYEILLEMSETHKLKGLPAYEQTQKWFAEKLPGFMDDRREGVAEALAAQWGGKGWKWVHPWRTYQRWCRNDVERNRNITPSVNGHSSRLPVTGGPERVEEFRIAEAEHKAHIARNESWFANG